MPQGWVANRKKVQCLWREEGLKVLPMDANVDGWRRPGASSGSGG